MAAGGSCAAGKRRVAVSAISSSNQLCAFVLSRGKHLDIYATSSHDVVVQADNVSARQVVAGSEVAEVPLVGSHRPRQAGRRR